MLHKAQLCCLAVFSAAAIGQTNATAQESSGSLPHWRSVVMCGPNSLFLVLSSTGHCDDYDRFSSHFQPTADGVSVTELLQVAQSYGCDLKAYKMNFDDLRNTKTPAILHFKPVGGVGHFVVLLEVADDSSLVMDSTTGKTSQMTRGSLQDVWTGVVICESKPLLDPQVMAILGLLASIALLVIVVSPTRGSGKPVSSTPKEASM